jgi:hypothetical protein
VTDTRPVEAVRLAVAFLLLGLTVVAVVVVLVLLGLGVGFGVRLTVESLTVAGLISGAVVVAGALGTVLARRSRLVALPAALALLAVAATCAVVAATAGGADPVAL